MRHGAIGPPKDRRHRYFLDDPKSIDIIAGDRLAPCHGPMSLNRIARFTDVFDWHFSCSLFPHLLNHRGHKMHI